MKDLINKLYMIYGENINIFLYAIILMLLCNIFFMWDIEQILTFIYIVLVWCFLIFFTIRLDYYEF